VKDYEHVGVRPEDLKLYTHFKTKGEKYKASQQSQSKVLSSQDDMMMMFTFMDGAELKDMITKDKSGGKSGKFEKVNYMERGEAIQLQQKITRQNQERR